LAERLIVSGVSTEAPVSDFRPVGETITTSVSHPPEMTVPALADAFFRQPNLDSVAVVEGTRPVGLITRQKFLFTVFRRFGWEVFGRKKIAELTDRQAAVVIDSTPLDQALAMAVERRPEDVYDDLIIVDARGDYRGLLSVRQMIIHHSHVLANILAQKDLANERSRELEKISEIKSRFLANVTHELRSPVNAILELGELIRMAAEKGYVGQVKDRLSLLLSSATNLRSIITNILDLSRIEAGKMQVMDEDFELAPLLQEIVDTTRVLIGDRSVDVVLVAEPHGMFHSDPVKIRQILLNLMSNAAKFTEVGRITLQQTVEGQTVTFHITDTGIGIREEDVERLFEAFSQLEDAKSKRHQGTGLGLTITKELVDLLGGSIELKSEFGTGTTFIARIPTYHSGEAS